MATNCLQYIQGNLCLGGRPLHQFINNYQHPVYIYNLGLVEERFRQMQKALPGVKIFFAMKSNSNVQVMKTLKDLGACVDVVSQGEIQRSTVAGFLPHDIVFSGVGKTVAEITDALERNVYQINVESVPELLRISEIARRLGVVADVALRLNPNIDIKTHPYIATGLHENKFGIEISELVRIEKILNENSDSLSLVGLSLHLGSQMKEFDGFRQALALLKPIYLELKSKFPSVARFDVGGGLGVKYEEQDLASEEAWLAAWSKIILDELLDLNAEIQCEPGRWLVAHAGVLLSQVQYKKVTPYKTFLVLDTGMNHLMRPSLYQAVHQIWPVTESQDLRFDKVDVVGPICESADSFVKDISLPVLEQGAFVVIADVGAYGYTMSNHYNLREIPLEVFVESKGR